MTSWNKIAQLENDLDAQNSSRFLEFVDILKKNSLLSRHMYHAICESVRPGYAEKAWELLHEMANEITENRLDE